MALADLLGPYGEGYCGSCQFIVGLDPKGRLERHYRGRHLDHLGYGAACKGSGRAPWKRTPYACRRNIFRFKAPKVTCPGCGVPTVVIHHTLSGDRLKHHWPDGAEVRWCTGSNQLVVGGRVMMPA